MDGNYWLAVNSNKEVTIHQHEPVYNELYNTWRSIPTGVYINKDILNILIDIDLDKTLLKAYALEIDSTSMTNTKKLRVVNNIKIYKDKQYQY